MRAFINRLALQTIKRFLAASAVNLRSADWDQRLVEIASHWIFRAECVIPTKYLVELWPDINRIRTEITMGISHPWELPYGDRAILDALVRYLRPLQLFEFGTFTGATATLLADAAPTGAVVNTLDLPDSDIQSRLGASGTNPGNKPEIGLEFLMNPKYEGRIVSHRCASRKFEFRPFRGTMDFIFIDASHEYEDVLHDTERALEMLSSKGVIVWDDYVASVPGVFRALNHLARRLELVHIAESRLVVHRRY